ncbi:uncharacterized protein [Diadema antillarum]|uniref:uncharacterized protein n=2 Tax=Diadema antillarum TaxID=105358 RepID=UPI003A8BAF7F
MGYILKRGQPGKQIYPSKRAQKFTPCYSDGASHMVLYNLLAAFIAGQILLTIAFLLRSAPPCDCRCQWRSELEKHGPKAGRSLGDLSTLSPFNEPAGRPEKQLVMGVQFGKREATLKQVNQKNLRERKSDLWKNVLSLNVGVKPQQGALSIVKSSNLSELDNQIHSRESIQENKAEGDVNSMASGRLDQGDSLRTRDRSNTIPEPFTILATTNTAFSDLTENWLESLRRLKLPYNITLIAEDVGAFDYFTNRLTKLRSSGLRLSLRLTDMNASSPVPLGFHTKDYIRLVGKRPHYILEILRSGIGVLFADPDAVWLKDPIPLIAGKYLEYDVWVAQGEGGQMPCPCFMYIKPFTRAINLVKAWHWRIEEQLSMSKPENDQIALTVVMNNHINFKNLQVRKLDMTAFPTGQSMFLKKGWFGVNRDKVYVVHANKVGGHVKKKFVLRWKRLWYIGKDS